jgi:hypothetical protein
MNDFIKFQTSTLKRNKSYTDLRIEIPKNQPFNIIYPIPNLPNLKGNKSPVSFSEEKLDENCNDIFYTSSNYKKKFPLE